MIELADRLIGTKPWPDEPGYWDDLSPGRRLRVFARLVRGTSDGDVWLSNTDPLWPADRGEVSYATLLSVCEVTCPELFTNLALATSSYRGPLTAIPAEQSAFTPPSMNRALQDLMDDLQEDISDAGRTLTDPNYYYPGVDDGSIEPVPDDLVRRVIWGMQRQLNRDVRSSPPTYGGRQVEMPDVGVRPALPLAELAWPVQRALAERRRLRFQQWGIGRKQWERNAWSLWDVSEDPDYVPRRAQRGRGRGG